MCEHEGHGSCHGAIEIPGIYGLGSINIVETWKKSELQKFQVICSECESVCVCMRPANAFLSDWTVLELTVGIVLVNSIHSCIVQSISISQIHPHVTESHWVLLMVWASPLEGQRSCDHIQTVHWQLHNSSNLRWDKWYLILGADSSPHAMYTMQQLYE